jgi:hypothetical protein
MVSECEESAHFAELVSDLPQSVDDRCQAFSVQLELHSTYCGQFQHTLRLVLQVQGHDDIGHLHVSDLPAEGKWMGKEGKGRERFT